MKQFINSKENIVQEAVDGLVATSYGNLVRLDGYPHIRVVTRKHVDKSKVALISGGGSGHEPAHAGLVGEGLLTAAICGEVFASPSVDAVLAGILAVTGDGGCLLIVKNYTGDRLNFGLAAERARALGLDVNIVIVDDDIALPDIPQARGIAGTVLVHKIAGALAEDGSSLDTVTKTAERVVANLNTIGVALTTCTIPGIPKEERIPEGACELGLGIHGEPGVKQLPYDNAKSIMGQIASQLSPYVKQGQKHVALLNNLGGTTVLEMSILAHELMQSDLGKHMDFIVGPATIVGSLDMHGFSVSLYQASDDDITALQAPTPCLAWPTMQSVGAVEVVDLPSGIQPLTFTASDDPAVRDLIKQCCDVFIATEDKLNILDSKLGDGDTGSTLATAAKGLMKSMDTLPLADPTALYRAIGQELSTTMGGSSGVLLAILFAAAGDASSQGASTQESLMAGLNRMKQIGGADVGDRTMVDALEPALLAFANGMQAVAKAAREGADKTAAMEKANSGRASYVNAENLKGNVDPGAEAVALLFEHMAQ